MCILATCIFLENLCPLLILKWAINVIIDNEFFGYKALLESTNILCFVSGFLGDSIWRTNFYLVEDILSIVSFCPLYFFNCF